MLICVDPLLEEVADVVFGHGGKHRVDLDDGRLHVHGIDEGRLLHIGRRRRHPELCPWRGWPGCGGCHHFLQNIRTLSSLLLLLE